MQRSIKFDNFVRMYELARKFDDPDFASVADDLESSDIEREDACYDFIAAAGFFVFALLLGDTLLGTYFVTAAFSSAILGVLALGRAERYRERAVWTFRILEERYRQ